MQFDRRAPLVGDQLEQNLSVGLNLDTMVRQNQQVLEKSKTALRREQRRIVTTTHVQNGTPVAVMVRYAEATKEIAAGTTAGKLGESKLAAQPVRGKAYRVRRDGEALLITDETGQPCRRSTSTRSSRSTWSRSAGPTRWPISSPARRSPSASSISLPNEVAEKLMGLGGELGKVTRFDLTLEKVATIDDRKCAVFQSSIEAASNDSSQMRLAVEGPLAIEIDTCRAVEATFAGPIGMSETRGSLSATYQMTGTGKMTIHIASKYSDLQR